jgi:DNA-binding Lrp family transcriptional regulator
MGRNFAATGQTEQEFANLLFSLISMTPVRTVCLHNLTSHVPTPVVEPVETTPHVISTSSITLNGLAKENNMAIDALDARIIELFAVEPRVGVLEASRRLGVARGTVQARLDRLERSGVVRAWGPDVDTESLGYPVTAFITLEIRQGRGHDPVGEHLASIPEVIEAHTVTGPADLWCRVVARSNADLQLVLDRVLAHPGIERSATMITLATQIPSRVLPLVAASVRGSEPTEPEV